MFTIRIRFSWYIGKDGHGHAGTDRRTRGHERRTVMEKADSYGKGEHLWKRQAFMEKTCTYGKERFLVERLTPRTTSITYIVNKIQNTILTDI